MTIAESGSPVVRHEQSELLRPYVPRLMIDWLRVDPTATHRELEASLVFVDISGFTALTEQLGRRGKVGAELMRDTLDGVFTALLDEATSWGADLLKWGGDAMLLMFDGPGHAWRACRAAWEMQGTIDRVGRLQVAGSQTRLRMSVGIGTGRFDAFMASGVHRELLIAGPAMTETLAMEAAADAGEVGISPAVVALLPPSLIGRQKDGITLLGGPPDIARMPVVDVGDVSDIDIASSIPIAARAHVLLKKSEPEHRTITAAFIDLMAVDGLLADLGPEALARGLEDRMRSIQEIALRYEVPFYETDVGKSSVKALLTAGAPSSTGHDDERMLRALRDIVDVPGIVPMRIGVNTGTVFTGDFGPSYRRAYRVFGDAINTAARVMSKAEAGQILSTEIVLSRSRTIFVTTPIEPFAAKGKAEPVRAAIVGPATGRRETRQGGPAMLGRELEFAALQSAVERARGGQGTVVEVTGGPGMGKSRLIEELVANATDFQMIAARCEEFESATPYFPFRAIVRRVIDAEPQATGDAIVDAIRSDVEQAFPDLAPWLPLLGILVGVDVPDTPETAALDKAFLREPLSEVALRYLGGRLRGSPTIFVVEDAQHIDEASLDLLQRLSTAAKDRRQLLILTREGDRSVFPVETPSGQTIEVELGPMSEVQARVVLEAATEEAPLHPHVVEELARRSGGNPMFLFQLLDAFRASGSLETLPGSIESLVAAEIDRLAPSDRSILRYAAVLGTTIDRRLLGDCLAGEVELDDGVWDRLAGLLVTGPTGEPEFRTTFVHDAAYEGLPYRRRRELHARVGQTIEATAGDDVDEVVGVLALHYHEAQRWGKAWRFCREAGDRARAVYANIEAARYYELAVVAGRRLRTATRTDMAQTYGRIGDIRFDLGEPARADRAFRMARRLAGDPAVAAGFALKQAAQATTQGRYAVALRRTTRAIHALEGVRGREAASERARLYVWYGWVRAAQDRPAEALTWYRRAIDLAKRVGARDALAQAYQAIDSAYFDLGDLAKAVNSPKALAIYEDLGNLGQQALTLNNMGVFAKELSRWSEAREMYDRARQLFEQVGDRAYGALVKYNIAEILSDQGHVDEAVDLLRDVIRQWRAAGAETDVAEARREMARALARGGDIKQARRLLDDARAVQVAHGQPGEVLTTDARSAEVDVLAGDSNRALKLVDELSTRARATDGGSALGPTLARIRGWAQLQLGRSEDARDAFEESRRQSHDRRDEYQVALALDGLIAARAPGADLSDLETERLAIVDRLGIAATPVVPLEEAEAAR